MTQADRAKRKVQNRTSAGWNRDRMTETHRKGKRSAKKQKVRAERRLGGEMKKEQ